MAVAIAMAPVIPVSAQPLAEEAAALDCAQPTRTLSDGSAEPLSLRAAETVVLTSGSFTGSIKALPAGSRLCIAADATVSPTSTTELGGQIYNAGVVTLPGLTSTAGFELHNTGETRVNGVVALGAGSRIDNRCRLTMGATIDATASPAAPSAECTVGKPAPVADIVVTTSGPASVPAGRPVSFRVDVSNLGPDPAAEVVVVAKLPINLRVTGINPESVIGDGSATWRLGTVPGNNVGSQPSASVGTTVLSAATAPPGPTDRTPVASSTPAPTDGVPVASVTPAPNRPPVVVGAAHSVPAMVPVSGGVAASDPDEGQSVTFSISRPPISGTATLGAAGSYTYTPRGAYTGRDAFTVRACDNGMAPLCAEATVSIVILPAPRADEVMTWAGRPVNLDVEANDIGTATPTDRIAAPQHGNATPGGATVYTPAGSYTGWDTMRYRRCAPLAPDVCAAEELTVGVLPLAVDDSVTAPYGDDDLVIDADANDFGDAELATNLDAPDDCTVEVLDNGDFVYTPDADDDEDLYESDDDSFTYQLCSDKAPELCDTALVMVSEAPLPAEEDLAEWYVVGTADTADEEPIEATSVDTGESQGMAAGSWPALAVLLLGSTLALLLRQRRHAAAVRPPSRPSPPQAQA